MPSPQLDLDSFLPYRLSVLSNRISQSIARLYAEQFQISITEWRVLAVLGRYSGLAANEVAERTAMDKVAVSRAVARLGERGLIARSTHDHDRRRSVLELSANGKRIHAQIAPLALEMERQLLAGLDKDERVMLDRLLGKLSESQQRL
ncbi:MAG: MarR family winged helix-turn-helix transcriptional regulator [Pseudomonadota bacterium]|nr:MarR family winged helix-turn-helix transcriptional regulator [Pseudomonadota bacterium]